MHRFCEERAFLIRKAVIPHYLRFYVDACKQSVKLNRKSESKMGIRTINRT